MFACIKVQQSKLLQGFRLVTNLTKRSSLAIIPVA